MHSPGDSSRTTSWVSAAAIIFIGQAIALGANGFSFGALVCIAISIALVAIEVGRCAMPLPAWVAHSLMLVAIIIGLIRVPIADVFFRAPRANVLLGPFMTLLVLSLPLIAAIVFLRSRKLMIIAFVLLVAMNALMGAIAISSRVPGIDVYLIQKQACEHLLAGQNPYDMTFDDVYGPDSGIYPSGIVRDGRVQCGYFYPPLSLLLDVPGHLLGDVRFSHVIAVALSALMIGFMRPTRDAFIAAIMLMFSPRLFYQLQVAWIEPFVLLALCAAVRFAVARRMIAAAIALGMFFVSKHYALLTIPAAWLLLPTVGRGRAAMKWAIAGVVGALVVTVPFLVWNPHAFFHSLTALYVGIVRSDSISFLPPILRTWQLKPSLVYPAVAALPAIGLCLWRSERTPSGFAAAVALILLCVFAFSTQSFGNYYFLAIGALCAAIAAKQPNVTSACADSRPSSAGHTDR